MQAAELFEDLRSVTMAGPVSTAIVAEDDAKALEVMYPIECPNGSKLWRRSALVAVNSGEGRHAEIPALFYDYLNEWNLTRLIALSDIPYSEEWERLDIGSRSAMVDLSQERFVNVDRADIIESLVDYLHPDRDDAEINETLDAQRDGAKAVVENSDFDIVYLFLDNLNWALELSVPCVQARAARQATTSESKHHVVQDTSGGQRNIYIDFGRLGKLGALYPLLVSRARHAPLDDAFWGSAAKLGRTFAELCLRIQNCRGISDTFERLFDGVGSLRHPTLQETIAANLDQAGFHRYQLLLGSIRMLQLDSDGIVDALCAITRKPAAAWALPAIELLGWLRAGRARATLVDLSNDRKSALREGATQALERIDEGGELFDPEELFPLTANHTANEQVGHVEEPDIRYFRGPKETTFAVTRMGDGPFALTTIRHPGGTLDMAYGNALTTKRQVAARMLGLIPPAPDDDFTFGMGEFVTFSTNEGKITNVRKGTIAADESSVDDGSL